MRALKFGSHIRRRLRAHISDKPLIYLPLARLKNGDFVVNKQSEIVIEGYPRSGNSFAEAAFRLAQGRPIAVAHHCHAAAQVLAASRWGIPTLVIMREPVEAVRSLLMHEPDSVDAATALREYVSFHRAILAVRNAFVLARFESVTQRFGDVIDAVNLRFGTAFRRLDTSPGTLARVYDEIDRLSLERGTVDTNGEPYSINRPHSDQMAREEQKKVVRDSLQIAPIRSLREEAIRLYENVITDADI